jgi:NADH-quinone oxidoreductase subunit K
MASVFGIPLDWYLVLSGALFAVGAAGVLLRRSAMVVLMAIEIMLNAVNILLVAFASFYGDIGGQVFVFFVMLVAAAEAAIGLAIFVVLYRKNGSLDLDEMKSLKW